MTSVRSTARRAGLLYVLFSILAVYGYFILPARFMVAGDATATAQRILADLPAYRLGLLLAFIGQLLFLATVATLYQLFKDVDRPTARFMLVLVSVGIACEIANMVHRLAPLVWLGGADWLAPLSRAQLDALAYAEVRIGGRLNQMIAIFWGLWLFPFGWLVVRSRMFPRVLGWLLWLAGVGYVVSGVTNVAFPEQAGLVGRIAMPLYFGELPIVLWLPILGARDPAGAPAATTPVAAGSAR